MKANQISPDVDTFNTLLSVATEGSHEFATVTADMQKEGIEPGWIIYFVD